MKRKVWLFFFLTVSLLLLLGGTRFPENPSDINDPVTRNAESVISQAAGNAGEWQTAARENPAWILQLEAVED